MLRKIATALFGAPPESSFAEALQHFQAAEELGSSGLPDAPGPQMTNRWETHRARATLLAWMRHRWPCSPPSAARRRLKLAQTHLALGQKEPAAQWARSAAATPLQAGEDVDAAEQLAAVAKALRLTLPTPAHAAGRG